MKVSQIFLTITCSHLLTFFLHFYFPSLCRAVDVSSIKRGIRPLHCVNTVGNCIKKTLSGGHLVQHDADAEVPVHSKGLLHQRDHHVSVVVLVIRHG